MVESVVLKFGGSSLTAQGLTVIKEQVEKNNTNGTQVVLVVSAVKKTTNNLMCIVNYGDEGSIADIWKDHNELCKSLNIPTEQFQKTFQDLVWDMKVHTNNVYPEKDVTDHKIKIIGYGELMSSQIVTQYLNQIGIQTKLVSAKETVICDSDSSKIDYRSLCIDGRFHCDKSKIEEVGEEGAYVVVTQGYIASTSDGKNCLLTRSGSDTSASLIGAGLNANRVEIWTDVDGIYTADPRICSDAQVIEYLNYDVCQELAAMGTQVVHPYCIRPCQEKNIPLHIKNTFNSTTKRNTVINGHKPDPHINETYSVTNQKNVTVFYIESLNMWNNYGFVHDIFSTFSKYGIDVNIVTTSQFSITTTTDETSEPKLEYVFKELAEEKGYSVRVERNCNIVSVVADDILKHEKIHDIINLLNKTERDSIHIVHFSSNNMTVSVVVDRDATEDFINLMHKKIFH